jgi:DNA-binding NtrC family response regulator
VIWGVAKSDMPVVVLAESGAGKNTTAQRIHQMSQRSTQHFQGFQRLGLEAEQLEVLEERESQSAQLRGGTIYLEELPEILNFVRKRKAEWTR